MSHKKRNHRLHPPRFTSLVTKNQPRRTKLEAMVTPPSEATRGATALVASRDACSMARRRRRLTFRCAKTNNRLRSPLSYVVLWRMTDSGGGGSGCEIHDVKERKLRKEKILFTSLPYAG
mmetsp:Transcript_20762/g.60402  ORF Transcript_20762/g.60402 Transcript_20762/m.60402 type:complete len:120 (-) Transcript_20762:24-383(-)